VGPARGPTLWYPTTRHTEPAEGASEAFLQHLLATLL